MTGDPRADEEAFPAAALEPVRIEDAPIAFAVEDGEDAFLPEGGPPRPRW